MRILSFNKKILIGTLILILLLPRSAITEDNVQKTFPPFAIVELYTSESCSSCPPADRLLGQIAQKARRQSLPIYTLSFHVDY